MAAALRQSAIVSLPEKAFCPGGQEGAGVCTALTPVVHGMSVCISDPSYLWLQLSVSPRAVGKPHVS